MIPLLDADALPFDFGVDAYGVLISDMPPIGSLWLDLRPGLTVFYGLNGVGKSTVLSAIEAAFTGVQPRTGRVELHCVAFAGDDPDDYTLGGAIRDRLRVLARRCFNARTTYEAAEDPERFLTYMLGGLERYSWNSRVDPMSLVDEVVATLAPDPLTYHTSRVVLRAVGTTDAAGWLVGVSAVPRQHSAPRSDPEMVAQHDHLEPALPVLLSEYTGRLDGDDDDDVEALVAENLRVYQCIGADDRPDAEAFSRYLQALTQPEPGQPPDLIGIAGDNEFEPSARLQRVAEELGRRTTRWVQMFTGEPLELRLELHHPNWWPTKGLSQWVATDSYGAEVPVEQLGSGLGRWAQMAINIALARVRGDDFETGELVIDEPERGLHSAAQLRAAEHLAGVVVDAEDEPVSTFVATHAPAFSRYAGPT